MATAFVTEDVKAFKALASVMRHELPEDLETRLRTGRKGIEGIEGTRKREGEGHRISQTKPKTQKKDEYKERLR